jgi:hypothetical protein
MLLHVNPWTLISHRNPLATTGSTVPGFVMLIAFVFGTAYAIRFRERSLFRLQVLVAASLLAGIWSMSRMFGFIWYYEMLWAWALCGLVLVTIVWSGALFLQRRSPRWRGRFAVKRALAAIAILVVWFAALFVRDAARVKVPDSASNAGVGTMVNRTISAIAHRRVPGNGRHGTYWVMQTGAVLPGGHAFTFVNELERAGFKVKMHPFWDRYIGEHRTTELQDTDALIEIAVGDAEIRKWETESLAVKVLKIDPASPKERERYGVLRDRLRSGLVAAGLEDLVGEVDTNPWNLSMDNRVPLVLRSIATTMSEIGLPEAIFVAPIFH